MLYLWCVLLVSILPKWSIQVELSMRGTVNLGHDVVNVLARYIEKKKGEVEGTARRSYSHREQGETEPDTIANIVSSVYLCRELEICKGELEALVNKYITMLAEGIESVFRDLINKINRNNGKTSNKAIIFEEGLKETLNEIKKLIRNVNDDRNDVTETWMNLIKKISAKFVDQAKLFASQRLEGNADEVLRVKKHLTQKIVIVTSLIELKFENILCYHQNICMRSYICTKALNEVFDHLEMATKNSLSVFIKYFYETLPGTNFYDKLNDATTREFQAILREMSGTDNDLAKNIIAAIHTSVEARQKLVVTKFATDDTKLGRDVKLVHIILSDMDFLYSKERNPFQDFLAELYEWLKEGGGFGSSLRRLMRDLEYKLSSAPNDLVMKLIDEVKVFMEITVDRVP